MFWKRRNHQRDFEMAVEKSIRTAVQATAQALGDQMAGMHGDLAEKADAALDQLTKLGRLQYRSSHDIADRLQKLTVGVEELIRERTDAQNLARQIAVLEEHIEDIARENIRLIDDLDALCDSLTDETKDTWAELLKQWTGRLLAQLNDAGMREIHVLGAPFDPAWCESVETVEPDRTADGLPSGRQPYEVVKVIRRGYVRSNGEILRKAQVITMRGETTLYGDR